MVDLSRKTFRDELEPRREPHWQRLCEGGYLGFRAGAIKDGVLVKGPGSWIARFRARGGKQHHHALHGVRANDYDGAKREAEEWLARMGAAGVRSAKRSTVRAALEAYLQDLERHGRPDAAYEAEKIFRIAVWEDPIANASLESVTKTDFLEWRARMVATGTRKPRSVNRYVTPVAAGLNRALDLGYIGNPRAWKMSKLVDEEEDEGTAIFLTPEQRKAFVAAAEPYIADFLRAMELTGGRPHEIARAKVQDFDGEQIRLAHKKGMPPKLKIRYVVLGAEGVAHMKRAAAGKKPKEPLFTDPKGRAWIDDTWIPAVRAAVKAHNEHASPDSQLPPGTRAYCMRHARISELLQVYGIDPLTVAKQTGTSLLQIEKTYWKFIGSALKEKLAAVEES